jgi:hypothetical protein
MHADVPESGNRNGGTGRIDRDAAPIRVGQRDHVVDARIARQNLGFDSPHRVVDGGSYALNGRGDAKDVLGAG